MRSKKGRNKTQVQFYLFVKEEVKSITFVDYKKDFG